MMEPNNNKDTANFIPEDKANEIRNQALDNEIKKDAKRIQVRTVMSFVAIALAIAILVLAIDQGIFKFDADKVPVKLYQDEDVDYNCKPYQLKLWADDSINMHGYKLKLFLDEGDGWKYIMLSDGTEDDYYPLGSVDICDTGLDFPDDNNRHEVYERLHNQTRTIALQIELDEFVKVGLIEPMAYSFGSYNGTSWKNYDGELQMLDLDEDGVLEETIVKELRFSAMRGGGYDYQYSCRDGGYCGDILAHIGIDGHVLFCDVKDQSVCFMGIKK